MSSGGHFAALEEPVRLAEDIRDSSEVGDDISFEGEIRADSDLWVTCPDRFR